MLPADPKYIGTAIEMCASTFGCDVPNELGLKIQRYISKISTMYYRRIHNRIN